jgi:hypothetical protein
MTEGRSPNKYATSIRDEKVASGPLPFNIDDKIFSSLTRNACQRVF